MSVATWPPTGGNCRLKKPACSHSLRNFIIAVILAGLGDVLECLPGLGMNGGLAGEALPPVHRHIDVVGVDLERARLAACALSCNQHSAAPRKGIEHYAVA